MPASSKDKGNCAGEIDCNVADASWLIEILNVFDSSNKMWQVSKNVCIYRVPKAMTLPKPQAYTPLVVGLGPYHHFNPEFSRMNSHKMVAVNRTLTRLPMDVTVLISEFQNFEFAIRECYEEEIRLDGKQLFWMVTMDACFILEYFKRDDPAHFSLVFQYCNTMAFAIMSDIMKLENQIPLFILLVILQLEFKSRERATTELAALLSRYDVFSGYPFSVSEYDNPNISELKKHMENNGKPPRHLLDLSRMVVKDLLLSTSAESGIVIESKETGIAIERLASSANKHGRSTNVTKVADKHEQQLCCISRLPRPRRKVSFKKTSLTPSAYLLGHAGIEIKPGKLDFEKGISGKSSLSLPQINVDDRTETVLRNLMAYEECQNCSTYWEETVITQLIIMFGYLITSEKDYLFLKNLKSL